jgi:hypothetical protein
MHGPYNLKKITCDSWSNTDFSVTTYIIWVDLSKKSKGNKFWQNHTLYLDHG